MIILRGIYSWLARSLCAVCILILAATDWCLFSRRHSLDWTDYAEITHRYPIGIGSGEVGGLNVCNDSEYVVCDISNVRIVVRSRSKDTGSSTQTWNPNAPPGYQNYSSRYIRPGVLRGVSSRASVWWYPPGVVSIRLVGGESFIVRHGQVEVAGFKAGLQGDPVCIMIDGYECGRYP